MRAARLSTALLGGGLLVGAVAAVGLTLGFEPARLPPVLLNIAAYKLTFIAALGLIAAGAVVRRYVNGAGATHDPAARVLSGDAHRLGDPDAAHPVRGGVSPTEHPSEVQAEQHRRA